MICPPSPLLSSLNGRHGLLRRVVQIFGGNELQSAVLQQLLPDLHVGPLQPHHDGNLQIQRLGCLDDALGDNVALHDAAKDIHQNRLDGGIGRDDLEGVLHLLGGRSAPHVQEIGGLAAVQADNVHRGHGQPGPVHHAPDVAVQADVVEIPLVGVDLAGILLRVIPLGEDVLLTKHRIVIETDLGVGGDQLTLGILGERIHLDHGAVPADEYVVQRLDLIDRGGFVAGGLQSVHDLHGLLVRESLHEIDGDLDDLFGILLGEIFDGRSALGARDDHRPSGGPIHENGEVHLPDEGHLLGEEDGVDRLPLRPALLRDERLAEHLGGVVGHLGRLDDVDAALHAGGAVGLVHEFAESSSARQYLGFDHHLLVSDFGRGRYGLFDAGGGYAEGDVHARVGHDLGRLILVQVEIADGSHGGCGRAAEGRGGGAEGGGG
mmetsp:Transcript_26258/g.77645  ORF Transcript_26258/g.77645 Transcript_26258/m.77645 type:complete len:434 (+) Transcript_26258:483-1784(+)